MNELFENLPDTFVSTGPVECLGIEFENDEQRREYFLKKLAEKLQDPEFRKLAGFPVGNDEEILKLSDPPYYTACPNPFIEDFVNLQGTKFDSDENYIRKPFASDVSEGKSNSIYNAHTYHTKVPHKAIMRYILHYTNPGDLVMDGFCGSGMTGIAAQLSSDEKALKNLGFITQPDGSIIDSDNNFVGKIGVRKAILNDLSPAATLITAGYNFSRNFVSFSNKANEILEKFYNEYGWMFETTDSQSSEKCLIDFVLWSEIFSCPVCDDELEFWSLAFDKVEDTFKDELNCPNCSAEISKRDLVRKETSYFDKAVNATRTKQVLRPVEIHYKHGNIKKEKLPDPNDLKVLTKIDKLLDEIDYPTDLMMFMPEGERWGVQYHKSVSRVHDFYLSRQLLTYKILRSYVDEFQTTEQKRLWFFLLQSISSSFTRRNRFRKMAIPVINSHLNGTLFIPSIVGEPSPKYALSGKLKRIKSAIPNSNYNNIISTQSFASVQIPENSLDYVFIDPPFGDNLSYAELNFMWEAWLKVFTNMKFDTVINRVHGKKLSFYTEMMTACMKKVNFILKPGRWVTVEFHNSKNSVWTAIQEAIGQAGLIVADVRILDKEMLTKNQTHANAVNKDLVISAYKPNSEFENEFNLNAGTEEGVWAFVHSHLEKLPVSVKNQDMIEIISDRQNHVLFDRMVAFHVQRDLTIPISAADFYSGLEKRFLKRDNMYFLSSQVAEYDKTRMSVREILQLELAISDEESAIQWIRQKLSSKPQTAGELKPVFMQELTGWQKNEKMLELDEILEQNFLCYDGKGDTPSQIHSYLSSNYKELRNKQKDDDNLKMKGKDRWYVPDPQKAGDLEKLRERALLHEFKEYREAKQRQLKQFRIEAIRAGFKKAWQERDYSTIIEVADKIPDDILQSDPKLIMWYDQAVTRIGN